MLRSFKLSPSKVINIYILIPSGKAKMFYDIEQIKKNTSDYKKEYKESREIYDRILGYSFMLLVVGIISLSIELSGGGNVPIVLLVLSLTLIVISIIGFKVSNKYKTIAIKKQLKYNKSLQELIRISELLEKERELNI